MMPSHTSTHHDTSHAHAEKFTPDDGEPCPQHMTHMTLGGWHGARCTPRGRNPISRAEKRNHRTQIHSGNGAETEQMDSKKTKQKDGVKSRCR